MAATKKSTIDDIEEKNFENTMRRINEQNAEYWPKSETFSGNFEKFKKVFKTLPSMEFALDGFNCGLNRPNYFYIKKERGEASVAALSDVSQALSIQYGITGKNGQPIRVITETKWATNLPPAITLLDEDIQKLNEEFIFVNVQPLRTYVDSQKKILDRSIFSFIGSSNSSSKTSIAAAEKLTLAMEYYNKHSSMDGFNGDLLTSQEKEALNQEGSGLKKIVDTALEHVDKDIRETILNRVTSASKRLEI